MAQRALITGVGGFIGSHLAEHLLQRGWAVDGIDHSAHAASLLAIRDRIGLLDAGTTIESLAESAVESGHYTAIFHLAGRVGPAAVVEDPLVMLVEHAQHTRAVCELAARIGAAVVLASSSEVYQWNVTDTMREDDALMIGPSHLPRCGYAVSKLNMEHLGLAYGRQRGVRVVVARLFNIVGPRQREGFVLPIFVRSALQGAPLTVHGDGSQIRTFTHVGDAVAALAQLSVTPAAYGEVVNVAAMAPCLPIATVAERIVGYVAAIYETVRRSSIVGVPYRATGDAAWERMRIRRPAVGKLQALTGLAFPDRWDEILHDVCADWAARLGVRRRTAAAPSGAA